MPDLIVNTNSYVTLDEANQMIADMYLSDSAEIAKWNELSPADKCILLANSAQALDTLWYRGKKAVRGQPLEFPRVSGTIGGIGWAPFISQYHDNTLQDTRNANNDGLKQAKRAQVRNTMAGVMLDVDIRAEATELSALGIMSKRRGSISETYDTRPKSSSSALLTGIFNRPETEAILKSWLCTQTCGV